MMLKLISSLFRRSFHYVASETDGARDSRVTLLLLGLVSLTVILRL